MADARQSPIPQDRVNENLDGPGDASRSKQEHQIQERHHDREERRSSDGTNDDADRQPGIPTSPVGPAEGGD